LKKLILGEPSRNYITGALARTGFAILPISLEHATAVETLPMNHKDPFDRLLISQAILENLPIVSSDAAFDAYPVTRLW
jgi:PIN domain nuclease of toxin-antitoxin system